ncbi:BRCT domain-containing protein [Vibrio parahaemolyticus]|uniref:anti-phage protein GapS2 n=1 Tax=Vibrio parahaemolyticus TaxID=670 RepID=UPI001573C5BE|nr:BRCT domain-containing protein [Vibrio parahaemolyticus]
MHEMTVFELLGIESGDAITVDNPWSDQGPREVIPLALSRNGISIRAIDCRYGDICYVSAEWTIFMSDGETLELQDFPYIAQKMNDFYSGKSKQEEAQRNICLEDIEREFASINEVLDTINLDSLKVAITGTLPLPRSDAKALLESKGAIVVGSVSKQTSFLFMGNTGRYEITEKMKKAHNLGVKVITL